MTIAASGAISFSDLQTEFGGSNPISLNEYYVGGSNVPSGIGGFNPNSIPSSGTISMSQFYDSSNAVESWSATVNPSARPAPYTRSTGQEEVWGYVGSNQATLSDTTPNNGISFKNGTIQECIHSRFTLTIDKQPPSVTHTTVLKVSGLPTSNQNTDKLAFDSFAFGSYSKLRSAASYGNNGGGVHTWTWTNSSTDTSTTSRTLTLDCFA